MDWKEKMTQIKRILVQHGTLFQVFAQALPAEERAWFRGEEEDAALEVVPSKSAGATKREVNPVLFTPPDKKRPKTMCASCLAVVGDDDVALLVPLL